MDFYIIKPNTAFIERKNKMLAIILIILGIGTEIVMANEWFVIPYYVPYILFGIGGVLLFINLITYFTAKRTFNKINKRF